jgi:hypothetical protein
MTAIWLSLVILMHGAPRPAVHSPHVTSVVQERAAESKRFVFRSGFWLNLHHFLYVLGRAQNGAPDRRRAAVANAPADLEGLAGRPEGERAAWDDAVRFYASGPSTKDAVFDDDLVKTTRTLGAAGDSSDLSGLPLDPQLVAALRRAAPVYRTVWWPRHSTANAARSDELQALVDRHGDVLIKRLTSVYVAKWPSEPRVIDLSAYSNWAGAYSTDGGLIVVSSTDEATRGPFGLETLLHESSHQWDDEIARRLTAVAAKQGKAVPGLLSHALIFFTAGELVTEVIPEHVPYAVKYGLWNQRGLGALKPLLDQYWRPYIRGGGTFEDAIAAILTHVP